jgi:hypothetical protein
MVDTGVLSDCSSIIEQWQDGVDVIRFFRSTNVAEHHVHEPCMQGALISVLKAHSTGQLSEPIIIYTPLYNVQIVAFLKREEYIY